MAARAGTARSRPRRTAAAAVPVLLAGTLSALPACRFPEATASPCPAEGRIVVVHAASHSLFLCRDGRAEARHRVALGRGGMDKRLEGDERTPTGRYPLGVPRASSSFHRFVPVGYPTAAQRAEGRTGGAIGIHGPDRRARFLGPLTTWIDWTAGCIAVGTDAEIDRVAEWTTSMGASSILIE
jgi:hypothetical protein